MEVKMRVREEVSYGVHKKAGRGGWGSAEWSRVISGSPLVYKVDSMYSILL